MKKLLLMGCLPLLGCAATTASLEPAGGSKADGTVEMAMIVGGFQNVKIDEAQSQAGALQRCRAWGYTAAEPFGMQKRACNTYSGQYCVEWLVSVTYQCTGGKAQG